MEPLHGTKFLMAETAHERLPSAMAEVVFVGRSNVGKSSLICAVTGNWKLARVSKTPGQTRAINVYEVRKGRWIVDLPGYGYAVGPARQRGYWPEMIGRYLKERATLKQVFVVVDAEVGPTDLDLSMAAWLSENGVPHRIVAGKTDKVGGARSAARRREVGAALQRDDADLFWVSAKDRRGLEALRGEIEKALDL